MPSLAAATPSLWEQWYHLASPAQREQLLDQARLQGLLFAHQLPAPEARTETSALSQVLTRLLSGNAADLPAVQPEAIQPIDAALDDQQRLAISRALATPDVACVLGYAGCGKSRVVAELLRQAHQRGRRVLFVGLDAPAVDSVLERLVDEETLTVLRLLDDHEAVAALSPCAARVSLPGRVAHFRDKTLPAARQAVAKAKQYLDRRDADGVLWDRLAEMAAKEQANAVAQQETRAAIAGLDAAIQQELAEGSAAAFAADWRAVRDESEQQLTGLRERLAVVRGEMDALTAEHKQQDDQRAQLQPMAEAKQCNRWWTAAWWKSKMQGDVEPKLVEIASRCQQLSERMEGRHEEARQLETEVAAATGEVTRKQDGIVAGERAARQQALDAKLAVLTEEAGRLASAWESLAGQLRLDAPLEKSPAAVHAAKQVWASGFGRIEADLQVRTAWLQAVEQAEAGLPSEMLRNAGIVAATIQGLPAETTPAARGFDLVVLEEAHRASEADLHQLARRGKRLVLVGDAPPDLPVAPPPRSRGRAEMPWARLPFSRLWATLHPDPRALPCRFRHANGRLVVRLRPVNEEQQGWLQREPVFDRPEVEIGIVAPPRGEPWVAEVSFPQATTVAEAKAFIFSEVQELAVQANESRIAWQETDASVRLHLSTGTPADTVVTLVEGLTERIGRVPAHGELAWPTAAFEFDKAAGWDRPRAERWALDHLKLRDSGRTTLLSKCYRARPALGRVVSALLYRGGCEATDACEPLARFANRSALEFVPVPSAPRGGHGNDAPVSAPAERYNGGGTATLSPRTRTARGGAGLEVDLADPRRPDALPQELRPHLPTRGVVNYLEACAVVAAAEEVVHDADFLAAWAEWSKARPARHACGAEHPCQPNAVAVLSAFPAQAELLRLLVKRSKVLAASGVPVEVGLPGRLTQRECLVALVSLTRSHASRAVPFSEHPRDLLLALTRAAGGLVLFGDPGTMTRRSQWFGPLDHLDEQVGPVEQALIGQLLGQWPEPEAAARAGRTRESSGV